MIRGYSGGMGHACWEKVWFLLASGQLCRVTEEDNNFAMHVVSLFGGETIVHVVSIALCGGWQRLAGGAGMECGATGLFEPRKAKAKKGLHTADNRQYSINSALFFFL